VTKQTLKGLQNRTKCTY